MLIKKRLTKIMNSAHMIQVINQISNLLKNISLFSRGENSLAGRFRKGERLLIGDSIVRDSWECKL